MATTFLEVRDLHAWYGESHVLHGVNFTVKEGEVVTLLGRNGAGRTSTLRAIMGLSGAFNLLFWLWPAPLVTAATAAAKSLF